jgi:hypothetical protein
MATKHAEAYLKTVLEALPEEGPGVTPKMIHDKIGLGAPKSVWSGLATLRERGQCRSEGPPSGRRYWRVKDDHNTGSTDIG